MIDIDFFNNDERIVINAAFKGVSISSFTRSAFLSNMTFAKNISTDSNVINLIDGLLDKIELLTDDDWNNIRQKIPFTTYYDTETNVDNVPVDEGIA